MLLSLILVWATCRDILFSAPILPPKTTKIDITLEHANPNELQPTCS
jgi:hypothetical protein